MKLWGGLASCGSIAGLILLVVGCSVFTRTPPTVIPQRIPLTPAVWFSPSVTAAELSYDTPCGEKKTMALADLLVTSIPKQLNNAFNQVTTPNHTEEPLASDGAIEVGVGVRRINLAIPSQGHGTYPATATVGMEMVFLARNGTVLFSKKLDGVGRGTVAVAEQSCVLSGLEAILQEAIDSAADGLAKQMALSSQIQDYAAMKDTWKPIAGQFRSEPVPPIVGTTAVPPPAAPELTQPVQTVPSELVQPAHVNFRAIIRDENRDQFLDPDESLTIEVEVKNEGTVEAKDVAVVVEGKDELAGVFPGEVVVGTLQPGEVRRTTLTNHVTAIESTGHGELSLSLKSGSPLGLVPPPKIFAFGAKPKQPDSMTIQDVDQLPNTLTAFKEPKAVIVTIGVGRFRDEQVPVVSHASHDAAVMAEYVHAIGNVPRERMRVLLDRQAQLGDLEETFERWLRKKADAATDLYVFFSGRALVDGVSGAVSLMAYDGVPAGPTGVYPIRQLQEAIQRLPIRRAVLFFDVSLDPAPGADLAVIPKPDWESGFSEARKDIEMWMVGNRKLQEAQAHDHSKHGLFTYYLLRGLQGVADLNRDSIVTAGELCTYAKSQVIQVTRDQVRSKQEPLCLPQVGRGGMARVYPIARGNNPKPAPIPNAPESSAGVSTPPPAFMQVGP
ncbi:hypothetical protein [Nitrospira sp. BLG_1]|uniref:hypothetical protein n=1 Tax=Nitrospira sp. BLG_1 TaxID=3395883 RepID=UPI0039BC74CB